MTFPEVIEAICDELRIPKPESLDKHRFSIRIDGGRLLKFEDKADGTGYIVFSALAPLLEGNTAGVCEQVMGSTGFGRMGENAIISISNEHNAYVLSESFDYENFEVGAVVLRLQVLAELGGYLEQLLPLWQARSRTQAVAAAREAPKKGVTTKVIRP